MFRLIMAGVFVAMLASAAEAQTITINSRQAAAVNQARAWVKNNNGNHQGGGPITDQDETPAGANTGSVNTNGFATAPSAAFTEVNCTVNGGDDQAFVKMQSGANNGIEGGDQYIFAEFDISRPISGDSLGLGERLSRKTTNWSCKAMAKPGVLSLANIKLGGSAHSEYKLQCDVTLKLSKPSQTSGTNVHFSTWVGAYMDTNNSLVAYYDQSGVYVVEGVKTDTNGNVSEVYEEFSSSSPLNQPYTCFVFADKDVPFDVKCTVNGGANGTFDSEPAEGGHHDQHIPSGSSSVTITDSNSSGSAKIRLQAVTGL